jgi:hypothetical protein
MITKKNSDHAFLGILVTIVGVKGSSYSQEHVIGSFVRLWLASKLSLANTATGRYRFPLFDIVVLQIPVMSFHADHLRASLEPHYVSKRKRRPPSGRPCLETPLG